MIENLSLYNTVDQKIYDCFFKRDSREWFCPRPRGPWSPAASCRLPWLSVTEQHQIVV